MHIGAKEAVLTGSLKFRKTGFVWSVAAAWGLRDRDGARHSQRKRLEKGATAHGSPLWIQW